MDSGTSQSYSKENGPVTCSKDNEAKANGKSNYNEENGPVPIIKLNSEGDGAAANSKSSNEMDELVADFKSNIKNENGAVANSKVEEPVSTTSETAQTRALQ